MHPPLLDGTIVQNRYTILRLLGQGGFGRTYLAKDSHRFQEFCVLKEFDPQTRGIQDLQKAADLFTREAGVLYQLRHPQIPQFRELFHLRYQGRELFFLVQDYVAGDTYEQLLEQRLQQGLAFSEIEVFNLLGQLLPVLEYIHQLGIIHRDISPDNIILRDSDQMPVLIDFGVVKAASHQLMQPSGYPNIQINGYTSGQTLVGKPGYAPPEQLHQGQAVPSSDLYSLGVTIVVLLTGQDPAALFDSATLTWHWQQRVAVSPRLRSVLEQLLSYAIADRYADAPAVIQALSAEEPGRSALLTAPAQHSGGITAPIAAIASSIAPPNSPVPSALATPTMPSQPASQPLFPASRQPTVALAGQRRRDYPAQQHPAHPNAPQAGSQMVRGETGPSTQPKSRADAVFDVIYVLGAWPLRQTWRLTKFLSKLTLGLVQVTVFGILRAILWTVLSIAAIVALIWTIPQIMPYVTRSINWESALPRVNVPKVNVPKVSLPDVRLPDVPWPQIKLPELPWPAIANQNPTKDYAAECKKLGIDYGDFITQVNTEFYKRHPELRGKALSQERSDQPLRDDWHRIAQSLLNRNRHR